MEKLLKRQFKNADQYPGAILIQAFLTIVPLSGHANLVSLSINDKEIQK